MVNWEQIAKLNGLTPKEFEKEIFTCAACVGAMQLDKTSHSEFNALKFTCSDEVGKIEVLIRRI
jgi:hypothetical protein